MKLEKKLNFIRMKKEKRKEIILRHSKMHKQRVGLILVRWVFLSFDDDVLC